MFQSETEAETGALGEGLARACSGRERILLEGDLGAGKTVFIKGIARGLGIAEDRVRSPSYVTAFVYPGRIRLLHIDLYRYSEAPPDLVEEMEEFDGVVAIEWDERVIHLLSDFLKVKITITESGTRRLEVSAVGGYHRATLRRWLKRYDKSPGN